MDLFTNRPPTLTQAAYMDELTATFIHVSEVIDELPNSRFKSLAMTKLEECSMWAKKATVFTVES